MKIEGLHNHTGKWIEIAIDIDDEDEARSQIEDFSRGGNSHVIMWGTPVNTHHFSAFRMSK